MSFFRSGSGFPLTSGADSLMYRELIRQSMTLAFINAFHMMCVLTLCVLVVIMQRRQPAGGRALTRADDRLQIQKKAHQFIDGLWVMEND
jgi:hypothetical protein